MTKPKLLETPPVEETETPSAVAPDPFDLAAENEAMTIAKPSAFSLDKFKSKHGATLANVETLLTALPHHSISQAKDFVRLHPDEGGLLVVRALLCERSDQGTEARHPALDRRRSGNALPTARAYSSL